MKKKHKKHLWTDVPRYRTWVLARDKALEQLHTNAQLQSADILRHILTDALLVAKSHYHSIKANPATADSMDWPLKTVFHRGAIQLMNVLHKMNDTSYTLSKASEAEIIAQLSTKPVHARVTQLEISSREKQISINRVQLYMDRLRRKVLTAAQSSAISAPDEKSFLIDVLQSFPRHRTVIKPKRLLKPQLMTEADGDAKFDIAIDNVDETTWEEMLASYTEDYIPKFRGPEYIVDIKTKDQDEYYAWEFERDMSNEFVQSVRDGQIAAATENGITDFVWIAVVDNRVDACCLWRDGLLVSEIEAQLKDHEDDDDECDVGAGEGLTPPIHFNCRCTLAPATDDIPAKPDNGAKDFADWLDT